MKTETTIVRHVNSLECVIATYFCQSKTEIRQAVMQILDCLEDGDSMTFEVMTE